ncbi:polysaccharide biosynthesis tyrosine autokinase [Paraburkholderia sp.]|uniref:polysaccharide biosynthesis tyrosine autokinase n=1 Tax=Paraburkholderia sp. TaxID=1926495 RepID=UPI002386F0F6|nr:polysaccharide biosynthesis tyrosine autokinase [Paraburkholderia sp.]MDE1179740.1 polysaccharide biosynthesis tyrosine autokinase [Paraburkholderia sp.]
MSLYSQSSGASNGVRDEINLPQVVGILSEDRRLIAALTAIALSIGVGYAFVAKPVFRADAMVQVDTSSNAVNDKLGDLAALFDGKATADAEIELIRSRELIEDTVRRLHLDIDVRPHYFPLIGAWVARRSSAERPANQVWGLGRFAWGGEHLDVAQFDVPVQLRDSTFTLKAGVGNTYELMDPSGDVVIRGRAGEPGVGNTQYGPVNLTVSALLARDGEEFTLARASTQQTTEMLQKALRVSEKTRQSGVISIQLDGPDSARTAETVNAIVRGYVQRNVGWKSAQAEQMLAFLGNQLPQLRSDLDGAESRYNAFRTKSGTIDMGEESRLLLQSIVDSKTRLLALQQQRTELLQRFASGHPSVASLDAQIGELQHQQQTLSAKVSKLPNVEQDALRLMRDVKVNTGLYTSLMDSAQQLRVLRAGQLGNVRVVDYAVATEEPVKPKKALVVGAATLFGLLCGCVAAFVRRSFHGGLETTLDIEDASGVPVYAVISHSERQLRLQRSARRGEAGPHVLASAAPDDIAIEGIRSLRTALEFRLSAASNNVVMITGPRPGVGKSFLSVNLAAVLAAVGKRVLLVDADMRRGNLHEHFGLQRVAGLQDVISGMPFEGAVRRQVFENLDLLTRGSSSSMPAEMLTGDRVKAVIAGFSGAYDVVILDTPPVLAVTDSALIGKHAGTTLLVVRHGRHPVAELRETTRLLGGANVTIHGVVLSDAPQRASAYGAFSAYHSAPE